MKEHFTHEVLNDHLIRIMDELKVAMYLVIGDDSAILIDTGYGYKGLYEYVTRLTDKPLIVLLSHGHVDHALGIYEFESIYMNENDIETYYMHSNLQYRKKFIETFSNKEFNEDDFQEEREIKFHSLDDEQVFDLGNQHVVAYHVPGHTKGMMMFLLKEQRIMLFGDACGVSTMIMEDCSGNLSDYLRSLEKVQGLEKEYDVVFRNHGTFESKKSVLLDVIEAVHEVLDGKDDKILLPDFMQEMFPRKTKEELPCYCAKRVDVETRERVDGKEGNINYRIDKVR